MMTPSSSSSSSLCDMSVTDAMTHERSLRSSAALKRDELRELVGGRYRELVSCADSIENMYTLSVAAVPALKHLEQQLVSVGAKATSALSKAHVVVNERQNAMKQRDEIVHQRIMLLTSFSRVFDELDNHHLHTAARIVEHDVTHNYASILTSNKTQYSHVFWTSIRDSVYSLRALLAERAHTCLSDCADERNTHLDALRALCTLNSINDNSTAALKMLLDTRTVTSCLSGEHAARLMRCTLMEATLWFEDESSRELCAAWWRDVVAVLRARDDDVACADERDAILHALYDNDGFELWTCAALKCVGRQLDPWNEAFHDMVLQSCIGAASSLRNFELTSALSSTSLQPRTHTLRAWTQLHATDAHTHTLHEAATHFADRVQHLAHQTQTLVDTRVAQRYRKTRLVDELQQQVYPIAIRSCVDAVTQASEALAQRVQLNHSQSDELLFIARVSQRMHDDGVSALNVLLAEDMLAQVQSSLWSTVTTACLQWIRSTMQSSLDDVAAQIMAWCESWTHTGRALLESHWTQNDAENNGIRLPCQCSEFALIFLHNVSQQLDDVMFEDFDERLLRCCVKHVITLTSSTLSSTLSMLPPALLDDTGWMQLLFDCMFILSATHTSLSSASSRVLLDLIRVHIDPMTLTALDSRMHDSIAQCISRCSVLLRPLSNIDTKPFSLISSSNELPCVTNVLPLATPGQRLPHLPISLFPSPPSTTAIDTAIEMEALPTRGKQRVDEIVDIVGETSSSKMLSKVSTAGGTSGRSWIDHVTSSSATMFKTLTLNTSTT